MKITLIPTPKPVTLRAALARGLSSACLLAALFAAVTLIPSMMSEHEGPVSTPSTGEADNLGRPNAPGSPAGLVEANDCWTGAAPADMEGKFPGHVVVRVGDAVAPVLGGERMVSKALAQVFEGVDHSLTIYGFCR